MATLVLAAAGEAIGASIGGTILGVTAAAIGQGIGVAIGSVVDSTLIGMVLGPKSPKTQQLTLETSTEGTTIPRIDGYMRLAGQIIWATKYDRTDGSGGGKGAPQQSTSKYSISFAVGLCEGVVPQLGRVWADGNLLDMSKFTFRFYPGDEVQDQDPLILEIEGDDNTPAYRNLCYCVFEDMNLTQFGNRIPQLSFELVRSVTAEKPGSLENMLRGVNLIPGAGEFVYETEIITSDDGEGTTAPQNENNSNGIADSVDSLNDLQSISPNMQTVSLVVGWFGDDERADQITIKPKVETHDKTTYPYNWQVDGIDRGSADVVSTVNGVDPVTGLPIPGTIAYGGTPSDGAVVNIIKQIKSMGWRVTFYPFLFMDVPKGNQLPDPYSDNAATLGQPTYPWRGRITPSPAVGFAGSIDKTSAVTTAIDNFFGSATPGDFSVSGNDVSWTGGDDWGWRRMVLHYAHLCATAGGVDAFLIGSELRGITRARSDATTYPAIAELQTLAADVKSILGSGTKVSYGADWSEYNNHQTGDASGDVIFNLDPLWSDSNIDFVGIDNYLPLSDWRDGTTHLDYNAATGPTSIYDQTYLQGNIEGGEDYDWYYASDADRDSQTRTDITDGLGKPWVFRQKDFRNWWLNYHYDRPSGTESGSHTGWVPQSKPIWFTELGCPAVDKGANEPNVFFDPKSSESFLPYYSNGQRDDFMQRSFLEAQLNYWADTSKNPNSTAYSAPMIDTNNLFLWCWDARPFPFFPDLSTLWGDAANYQLGDWLNGRLGAVLLSDLVAEICDYQGFSAYDVSGLTGLVTGYAITNVASARDNIDPLSVAFQFDAMESQGAVRFVMRGGPSAMAIDETALAIDTQGDDSSFGFNLMRAQEDSLPRTSQISYLDPANNYQQSEVTSKRLVGLSSAVAQANFPIVMDQATASGIGDQLIQSAWVSRETSTFALPPSYLALDPTDQVEITVGGRTRMMRITEIDDTAQRAISATQTDTSLFDAYKGPQRASTSTTAPVKTGKALLVFADLPMLTDSDIAWAPHVATFASPWAGGTLLYRSATDSNYALDTTLSMRAGLGLTTSDFYSGPLYRWDNVNAVTVKLTNGSLSSADEVTVLNGANILAIQNTANDWEIIQFQTATLVDTNTWTLTGLLRGQLGTEAAMMNPVLSGARMLILDSNIFQTGIPNSQYALAFNYLWGPSDQDISSAAYQGASEQFAGNGLRPYSPAQLGAVFASNGSDLDLSWIRRDRAIAADSWDQTEIPMSESSEAYDVEILDGGGAVARTLSSLSQASATYTAAQIASDFPSGLPNPFSYNVYQLSSVVGRGTKANAEFFFS